MQPLFCQGSLKESVNPLLHVGGQYCPLQPLGGFSSTSFPAATVRSLVPAFIPQCQISTSGESPTFHLLGHVFYRLQDPPKLKGNPLLLPEHGPRGPATCTGAIFVIQKKTLNNQVTLSR